MPQLSRDPTRATGLSPRASLPPVSTHGPWGPEGQVPAAREPGARGLERTLSQHRTVGRRLEVGVTLLLATRQTLASSCLRPGGGGWGGGGGTWEGFKGLSKQSFAIVSKGQWAVLSCDSPAEQVSGQEGRSWDPRRHIWDACTRRAHSSDRCGSPSTPEAQQGSPEPATAEPAPTGPAAPASHSALRNSCSKLQNHF